MASAQNNTAQDAARTTSRIPIPTQSIDWSRKVTPAWERVLADKNSDVSDLSTVNDAIHLVSQQAASLPDCETKIAIATQLALVQPIVEVQLSIKRDEITTTQKIISDLKAESVVPKTAKSQQGIILQLMQVLNSADSKMKVGELLERLQGNLISARDRQPDNEKTVAGTDRTKLADQKQLATKAAKSKASTNRQEPTTARDNSRIRPRVASTKPSVAERHTDTKSKPTHTTKEALATQPRPLTDSTNRTKTSAAAKPAAPKVTGTQRPMGWVQPAAEANKKIRYRIVGQSVSKKTASAVGVAAKQEHSARKVVRVEAANEKKEPKSRAVAREIRVEKQEPVNDASATSTNHNHKSGSTESKKDDSSSLARTTKAAHHDGYLGLRKEGEKGVARRVVTSKKESSREKQRSAQRSGVIVSKGVDKESTSDDVIIYNNDGDNSTSLQDTIDTSKVQIQQNEAATSDVSLDKQALYLQEAGVDVSNIIFGSRRRGSSGESTPLDNSNRTGAISSPRIKRKRGLGDDGSAPSKKILLGRNIAVPRTRLPAPTVDVDMMDLDSTPTQAAPLVTMPPSDRPRMAMPTACDPDEEL
ncbi:uncharacterized protein K460DRAFT_358312 [Cucurbitaria berberidis CBS 394.84]|uniref:Uncharacterized protein n=1 Tax=Cucurbitaria berberidis CBS 394.84 TaxID=1168544 RepID=A0A9P4G9R1_9PLEO|nr:uncharacterized protein K460DRAFT_358312 [Cucurbitaria berberidis CBS 394.84]KAF1841574.1 hypothetical protein K460DRAFT_358312 [Cucurbitaria berberidis CBS 394.84]